MVKDWIVLTFISFCIAYLGYVLFQDGDKRSAFNVKMASLLVFAIGGIILLY